MSTASPETPQTVIVTTKNTASLTLGIIAVVVGVLALLVGWVPFLGLLAMPTAFIGLLLAGVGFVVAVFRGCKGIGMPVLGGGICLVAMVIPVLSTHGTSVAILKAAEGASNQAPSTGKSLPVLVTEMSLGDNKPLKAGYIWQMESGKFYAPKSVPGEWQEGSADVKVTEIRFSK